MNDIELIGKTMAREKKGLSEDDLVTIKRAAGLQMNRTQIAALLGMDPSTLRRLEREYPSVSILIEQERTQRISPLAERALQRAEEDDGMNRWVLERKGGWENPNSGTRVSITNQNSQTIEEGEGNKLLDSLSEAELDHYRSLKPEDMLAILGMQDPSYELPDSSGISLEPSVDELDVQLPQNDTPVLDEPTEDLPKEGSSRDLKEQVYNRMIGELLITPGMKGGVPFMKQPNISSEDLDFLMREQGITNTRDKKIFTDLLLSKGVSKKRPTVDGTRLTLYVGCRPK